MTAVRGYRLLALVLAGVLAVAAAVFGVAAPASAATGSISGRVLDFANPSAPLDDPIGGLTVHLLIPPSGFFPDFEDVAQDVTAPDGTYEFSLPDLADDGDYIVYVDGGADWTNGSDIVIGYDHSSPGSGDVPDIELDAAYSISGIVMGNGAPVPDVLVEVYDSFGFVNDNTDFFGDLLHIFGTNADGKYTVKIPATTEDYTVVADGGPGWHTQAYNLQDDPPCGCTTWPQGDVVSVTTGSVGGVDFNLTPYDLAFDLYTEQETSSGSGVFNDLDGLTIVIEQLVGPTWTEIYRDTTDSSGRFYYSAAVSGTFRVRFEDAGSNVRFLDSLRYPRYTYNSVGGCSETYTGGPGTYIAVDFGFDSTFVSCTTPAPPSSPATPRKTRSTSFAIGSSIAPTPTPTPSATPTSSPSPSSSPSSEPSPSSSPTSPPTVNQGFDLWWLWIVLAVIVALILFFLVRLLLGRRP